MGEKVQTEIRERAEHKLCVPAVIPAVRQAAKAFALAAPSFFFVQLFFAGERKRVGGKGGAHQKGFPRIHRGGRCEYDKKSYLR